MIVWLIGIALADPVEIRVMERGTGDPLPEVEARLEGRVLQTDAAGVLRFDVEPGPRVVELDPIDHKPVRLELVVPLDGPLRVFLDPVDPPMEVVVEAFKPVAHATRHVIDAEMAFGTPGTHSDSFRLVQSLPGVTITREFTGSGEVPVRGSSPGDNRYYLDGVELPYIYHFNQYASVFPTSQIERLELFPSTFGSSYGDSVGAVVEARSKLARPGSIGGSATFNTIMVGGSLDVPLPRGWWASVAGRRSYHDLGGENSTQYIVWPRFHDLTARIEHGGADNGTGLFFTTAADAYARSAGEIDLLDPVAAEESPRFDLARGFEILGGHHRWAGSPWHGRVVAAVVRDHIRAELPAASERSNALYLTSRLDAGAGITDVLSWEAGYELRAERTRLAVEGAGPVGLLVAREAPALARGRDVDEVRLRARGGVYAEVHLDLEPVRLIPGIRVAFDSMGQPLLMEPRASVQWQALAQTRLEATVGRYHQAPETEHLLPDTGDPDLPTTGSWQASVGWEQTFARRLELSVDGYYKDLTDVLEFPVDGPAQVRGQGRSFGLELVTRYRLRQHVFLWGWFAWARTQVLVGDGWRSAEGDQPLSGGLVGAWHPSRHWSIGLRYRVGSGLPYTPVSGSVYDATDDSWAPIPDELNSARLPLYQKIDAQITHTWFFDRWRLGLTAEVWYVPKPSAQLYPTWSYDYRDQGWVIGPTLLPLLGLRATF